MTSPPPVATKVARIPESRLGLRYAPVQRPLAPAALLVGLDPEQTLFLEVLFRQQQWKLYVTATLRGAVALLRKTPVPVVLTERDLPQGDWSDLLVQTRDLPVRPLVVVASRLADEHLWAEVLNRGGHDVLPTPLRETEVLWVLRHAFGITKPAGRPAGGNC